MGRPKLYADGAEKQRAYRARRSDRTLEVDRPAQESMEVRLRHLRDAVRMAADAGNEVAKGIDTFTLEDTLDGVTALFLLSARSLSERAAATAAVKPSVPVADDRVALAAAMKSATGVNSAKQAARKQGRRR